MLGTTGFSKTYQATPAVAVFSDRGVATPGRKDGVGTQLGRPQRGVGGYPFMGTLS